METVTANNTSTQQELFISMVLNAWDTENSRVTKLLESLTDDQVMTETAPARNRGIYLLGHLIAVSDRMLPLLGVGERLYPHFDKIFLTEADRSVGEIPSVVELRKCWEVVNATLSEGLKKISGDEWFARHNSVSPEDFAKEPQRNKLNVIINRTNHTSYHRGQLIYLVKK